MEMALPLPWWRCWGWFVYIIYSIMNICIYSKRYAVYVYIYIYVCYGFVFAMASYYNWPTWGTHIEESLPLSAGRYITTPNMPAWDEDSKSSLSQLYMLGMHQCLLAIYNICLKNSGMPVNYSHGLKFKVKSHCGDNKASLAAHREEIRRPLLCHVSLWLAIANKLYI